MLSVNREKNLVVYLCFFSSDNQMGNRKSSTTVVGISGLNTKRFQENMEALRTPLESNEQRKKWVLNERDVAFLISQTGNYHSYLPLRNGRKIEQPVRSEGNEMSC